MTTQLSNTYDLGSLKFWALGDRVLIEEDKLKTGYECVTCDGVGQVLCDNCKGTGHNGQKRCSHCADGKVVCPGCGGKGALLVAPDIAQRRPTTGQVVSLGPECKTLKVGDNVLYSNFAGYDLNLSRAGRDVVLRILHETEILCAMDGHLDLRSLRSQSQIAEFGGTHG